MNAVSVRILVVREGAIKRSKHGDNDEESDEDEDGDGEDEAVIPLVPSGWIVVLRSYFFLFSYTIARSLL